MPLANHLLYQVDLQIVNQDWEKIRQIYQTLAQKINTNTLSSDTKSDIVQNDAGSVYGYTQYNMNTFGSVLRSDEGLSADWDTWCGPMLYRMLPWYQYAHDVFAGLTLQTIAWSVTYEDVKLHIDPKVGDESNLGQTKINYIVSASDPNAVTKVYDKLNPNISSEYLSIPNTAWLLNIDNPHEVKCQGRREVLQFKFLNDFSEVCKILQQIGPIRFDATK